MKEKEFLKKGFTTFIKSEEKGKCPCCNENVYSDQLYVEEDNKTYHFSCYNRMKAEDK